MQPKIESIVLVFNADVSKLVTDKVQSHDQQNQCNIASIGDSRQAIGKNIDREAYTSTPRLKLICRMNSMCMKGIFGRHRIMVTTLLGILPRQVDCIVTLETSIKLY